MTFTNEAEFQKECHKYLKDNNIWFYHIEKGRGKNLTHRGGEPDLQIRPGKGKVFYIELKMPNKKLRPEQQLFKEKCFDNDYAFYMCDTWNWFIDVLRKEGCII